MKERTILDITMRICFGITVFFMCTIGVRFLTKQICVDKLQWSNLFTRIVFWGDEDMSQKSDIIVDINWQDRYPFSEESQIMTVNQNSNKTTILNRYEEIIAGIEEKIEYYTEEHLVGQTQLIQAANKYNMVIGSENMPLNGGAEVITLNNGYLAYEQEELSEEVLSGLADHVSSFSDYLENQGIFFAYANAGSKVCPTDKQLPDGIEEYTNENADRLIELLQERSVPVLDFRVWQQRRYPNWYESYYLTDHHWKTTTSLGAAGVLAEYLNTNAGFSFDRALFDEENYRIDTYENYFLGCQGRALTTALVQPESFDTVIPNFETNLSIQIPSKGIDSTGTYEETLFDREFYEGISEYTQEDHNTKMDAYHAATWRNDALGTIQNHMETDNDGKRILMIQDSFGWYLSSYLALGVEEIDFLNLNRFTGSLERYIEETKPDAVVLLLCERNIRPIDSYSAHDHFFDFR